MAWNPAHHEPTPASERALSLGHGATLLAPSRTRFALWAPDARQVSVEIEGRPSLTLQAQHGGWFSGEADCGAGSRYRYRIDGRPPVPDPASRAQHDDVHGPSVVVDHAAYAWRETEWAGRPWHEAVIYELHVGLFGGFAQVEAYLPRLAELGITAIELMPINEFPGTRNWGYDGVLPFAPEASYGTPEQLKSLIDSAHALGLMVFLDVVYNHFGPDGNYLGQYAKGFFRDDLKTPWGAAIDFRRPEVRSFFIENALMWLLDYRFDGLRMDAVHAIDEKSFLTKLARRVHAHTRPGRHVHLIVENERNESCLLSQGFTAQWNDDGHNVLHTLLSGEREGYYSDFVCAATDKLAICLSEGFIYQGQCNRRDKPRGEPSAHLPPTAFVLFLQNHDQIGNRAFGERLIELANPDALKAATALVLLSPMVPLLFMGEEWGSRRPFLFFTEHRDELAAAVCAGRRQEFAEFSLFANPRVRERIPDPNELATFDAARPDFAQADEPEHSAWRQLYRQLLEIRRRDIIPRLQGSRALGAQVLAEAAVLARWRMGDGSVLRIELNLSEVPVRPSPTLVGSRLLFESQPGGAERREQGALGSRLTLVYLEARHE